MSRSDQRLLEDISAGCEAIIDYASRDTAPHDLVFDAMRIRLVEIGKAVKGLSDEIKEREPAVPWKDISRMRALHAAVLRLLAM